MKILVSLIIVTHIYSLVEGTITVEEPGAVIYHNGVSVELTCDVSPGVAWVVNDTSYLRSELRRGDLPGHNITGSNILIINNPMNNSHYACSDSDVEGGVYRILVADVPAMVPDVRIDNNTIIIIDNTVNLTLNWGEPFNNFDPIVNYTVNVSCSGDDTCPRIITTNNNTTRLHTITALIVGVTYTLSVKATNSIGCGEPGFASPGFPTVIPHVAVDNKTIIGNENTVTLTLNWGEPFNNLDPIVNYIVSCTGDDACPSNFTTTDDTTRNYTINNLTIMTTYTFSVVATNSIGSGEPGVMNYVTPATTMMFYQPQYRADEGTGHVQCVVVLSIQWSIDIIVQVITINGSAMGGVDYDSGPYIVTFLAGQTIATVNITIKDDNVVETNEIFTLNIISPSPFITVTIDQATVTIVDNDREVRLSGDIDDGDGDDGCIICIIIIIIVVIILLVIMTILEFCLCKTKEKNCKDTESADGSILCFVLLTILGVITFGISILVWYIYVKCEDNDKSKVKCCKIICVSIAVLGVYTLGISLLLWWLYTLMAKCCCKKDSTETDSPVPLSSPKVMPTEKESEVKQDEYAPVDKSHAKSDDKPDQQEPNLSGGINYADVEIGKGPNVMFGGDHAVYYAQTTS